MKFAVISDSHDNFANLSKALKWIKNQNIELVLHCGDICRQETMDDALKIFENIKLLTRMEIYKKANEIKLSGVFEKNVNDFVLSNW